MLFSRGRVKLLKKANCNIQSLHFPKFTAKNYSSHAHNLTHPQVSTTNSVLLLGLGIGFALSQIASNSGEESEALPEHSIKENVIEENETKEVEEGEADTIVDNTVFKDDVEGKMEHEEDSNISKEETNVKDTTEEAGEKEHTEEIDTKALLIAVLGEEIGGNEYTDKETETKAPEIVVLEEETGEKEYIDKESDTKDPVIDVSAEETGEKKHTDKETDTKDPVTEVSVEETGEKKHTDEENTKALLIVVLGEEIGENEYIDSETDTKAPEIVVLEEETGEKEYIDKESDTKAPEIVVLEEETGEKEYTDKETDIKDPEIVALEEETGEKEYIDKETDIKDPVIDVSVEETGEKEYTDEEFELKYKDFLEKKLAEDIEKRKITNANRINEEKEKLEKENEDFAEDLRELQQRKFEAAKKQAHSEIVRSVYFMHLNLIRLVRMEPKVASSDVLEQVQQQFSTFERKLMAAESENFHNTDQIIEDKLGKLTEFAKTLDDKEFLYANYLQLQNALYAYFKMIDTPNSAKSISMLNSKINELIQTISPKISDNNGTFTSLSSTINSLSKQLEDPVCTKAKLYSEFQELKKEILSGTNLPNSTSTTSIYRDDQRKNSLNLNSHEDKFLYKVISKVPKSILSYFSPSLAKNVKILETAENELINNNISTVVKELQKLEGLSRVKMDDWIRQAERYQDVRELIGVLQSKVVNLTASVLPAKE